jgi:hypothetical protein
LIVKAPLVLRLQHKGLLWLVEVSVAVFGCHFWLEGLLFRLVSDIVLLIVHVVNTANGASDVAQLGKLLLNRSLCLSLAIYNEVVVSLKLVVRFIPV